MFIVFQTNFVFSTDAFHSEQFYKQDKIFDITPTKPSVQTPKQQVSSPSTKSNTKQNESYEDHSGDESSASSSQEVSREDEDNEYEGDSQDNKTRGEQGEKNVVIVDDNSDEENDKTTDETDDVESPSKMELRSTKVCKHSKDNHYHRVACLQLLGNTCFTNELMLSQELVPLVLFC